MTEYTIKTIFPVDQTVTSDELVSGKKNSTIKQTDVFENVETADVIKLYNKYRDGGYSLSITFTAPAEEEDGGEEVSPFEVAESLTKQGIDYKATLKIKSKGEYEDMIKVMHLVEAEGFDMNVNVNIKVKDESTANVDNPNSWQSEDTTYKVSPKASSDDINDLKSLYDSLDSKGYEVEITIKPKAPKGDDVEDENDAFASQLSAYPDGTLITFRLAQSDE